MINFKKMSNIICALILSTQISTSLMYIDSQATSPLLNSIKDASEASMGNTHSTDSDNEGSVKDDEAYWSESNNDINADKILGSHGETLEDFEDRILSRMLDIVSLLQTIAKPLCIIFFIICAIGVLVSVVFGSKNQKMFIIGLALSVITYVAIIFAPDLVLFFAGWLSS